MPSCVDSPYVDAQGRTDAETYLMEGLDGTIVASKRIKALAEKMLPRIRDGYKQWRFDVDAATRPVEFIERFLMIPSGKLGVPFVLEPYERMIVELIFGFVDENEKRQFQYALVEMARKQGKALSLDTEIPTPDGWKLMRDIHPGDYVFGQDGKPSRVLVESEVFDKPMYLVTFEDGATVKASEDHIWTVFDTNEWCRDDVPEIGVWKDVTTHDIFGNGVMETDDQRSYRYSVPACSPVQYPEAKLSGNPYDIGLLVAQNALDEIPSECLMASVQQRLALLAGLAPMFEHGFRTRYRCNHRSKSVLEQVRTLLLSLGYVPDPVEENRRLGGLMFLVTFDAYMRIEDVDWSPNTLNYGPRHRKTIISIERIPNEPSKCIAIDSESHLYLAGRQFTATHNTSLGAALEIYMLIADGEGAPQIYNAATSKAQASLAYGAVWRMVRQSPKLMKVLRKGTVTERAENGVICDGCMGYVLPLSKQSDHLDGLDVHMCLFDEMAAAEDRSVFDLVRQGTGAREQPLMVAITTQGFVRDNLWDHERDYALRWLDGSLEDDRFLGILFEQDDRSEIWDESMWMKSNPGLGTVKKVEYLRAQVIKAKNDPSYMPTVLTKDFNLPANQASAYFTFDEAINEETYVFDPNQFRYCIVGLDAADTLDLNAATALFMRPGDDRLYRKSMYWIAEEQVKINSNAQRGRDGVPYQEWAARGLIRIVPGNSVPRTVFVDWIKELAEEGLYTRYVGLDPWGFRPYLDDFRQAVGRDNVEEVRQGIPTLSMPMKQLKAELRDKRIVNNHNPIDEWCNLNVSAKIDINENVQPVKKGGATTRIDGFMALLHAYVTFLRHEDDYKMTIGWDK